MFMRDFCTPLLAQWDITTACNFGCTFCFSNSGRRRLDELDGDQSRVVIDRLYDGGVIFLRVLGGEPFYRKDMIPLLQYAANKGMLLSFSTNASLVTPAVAKSLKQIEDSLNYYQVSLYGTTLESYKAQTLHQNGFALASRGICNMREAGLTPKVFWVLTAENMSQLPAAYELTKEWGLPTLRVSLKLNIGRGTADCSDSVSNPELWKRAIGHLAELQELVKTNGSPTVELHARPLLGEYLHRKIGLPFFFITCKAATTMIYVNASGECSPCPFECYMPDSFLSCLKVRGTVNILEHEVMEIWRSEVFSHYRELSDPKVNPNKILTGCKHFKSGLCDPCVFTPCTCVPEIAMARSGLKRLEPASAA